MTFHTKRFFTGSLFFILFALSASARTEHYHFLSRWQIRAPVDSVWKVILLPEAWPEWWPGVTSRIEVPGDSAGIGTEICFSMRGRLPYRLRFRMRLTELRNLQLLSGKACGDLEGTGIWRFREDTGVTLVEYQWDVVTRKDWMNRMAFLLKPVFRRSHDAVMRRGAKGLARRLRADLISY